MHTWEDTVSEAKQTAREWSKTHGLCFVIGSDHADTPVEVMNEAELDASMPDMDYLIAKFQDGEEI
jgi:hypothetical protein